MNWPISLRNGQFAKIGQFVGTDWPFRRIGRFGLTVLTAISASTIAVHYGVQDHQKSKEHCYCAPRNKFFGSTLALDDHVESPPQVSQFHCCNCDRDFVDEHALMQHLANKYHHHEANKCHNITLLRDCIGILATQTSDPKDP